MCDLCVTVYLLYREELLFCFCLNPLLLYFLWTAHVVYYRLYLECMILQMVFSYAAIYYYFGSFMGGYVDKVALLLPFVYAIVLSELKKGESSNITLFLVS
jgi:hypothetical protein